MDKHYLSLNDEGNIVRRKDGLVFLNEEGKVPEEYLENLQTKVYSKEAELEPNEELVLEHSNKENYETGLLVYVQDEGEWKLPTSEEHDQLIPYRQESDKSAVQNNTSSTKSIRLIAW